jgi:hypothetical protein
MRFNRGTRFVESGNLQPLRSGIGIVIVRLSAADGRIKLPVSERAVGLFPTEVMPYHGQDIEIA